MTFEPNTLYYLALYLRGDGGPEDGGALPPPRPAASGERYTLGAVSTVAAAAVTRAEQLLLEKLQPEARKKLYTGVVPSL